MLRQRYSCSATYLGEAGDGDNGEKDIGALHGIWQCRSRIEK